MTRPTVTILQHRLLHYRTAFFDRLRTACEQEGIQLNLVHGQPSPSEALKKDAGSLPWARVVQNRFLRVLGKDLLWQPFPSNLRDSDLVVIMQENRILSNYPWLFRRRGARGTRIAYWGHGANFQSQKPRGIRERWKQFLIRRVDWWFGYTETTGDILHRAGFPRHQVTILDNTIDTSGFRKDLEGVTADELEAARTLVDLAPGAPLGLFCGSLYPDKRIDLLVAACERIHAKVPSFRLAIIGDGPSRPELERLVQDHPWAVLLGPKRGRDKALWYRLASVILNPGATGLHILDAFVAEVPFLTTRTARHGPEIAYLKHQENGFLVEAEAAAFAAAVLGTLEHPSTLDRLREGARRSASILTLDHMVDQFMQGILGCLDRQRQNP